MKRECRPYWEGLVDLAEGRSNPAAETHAAGCADCRAELAGLRRTLAAGKVEWFEAPREAVDRAKSLMPARPRRRAVMIGSTLSGALARSSNEDVQVTLDLGGPRLRLLVSRERTGWSVVGQSPTPEWSVEFGGGEVTRDEAGRFRILVANLKDSAFVLRGPEYDVEVPAVTEILDVRD